ncbi:uncharacterized protein TrAtP1_008235 [Trichoderma atroviride]|uniref:uncharacterized protein n=1 Tax=Hypocrea atroviridis TaxID=63577 RepID=UPI00331860F1|nr:hypothetical protein TrAtP1_008235 [Trichoderma atroviride]
MTVRRASFSAAQSMAENPLEQGDRTPGLAVNHIPLHLRQDSRSKESLAPTTPRSSIESQGVAPFAQRKQFPENLHFAPPFVPPALQDRLDPEQHLVGQRARLGHDVFALDAGQPHQHQLRQRPQRLLRPLHRHLAPSQPRLSSAAPLFHGISLLSRQRR